MVIVTTGEDVMPPEPVTTKGYNSDGWFTDITDDPLQKRVTKRRFIVVGIMV
jgi:hypothetical protein